MRAVVVGASLAGVRTVQGLRRRGYQGEIVLVGHEPGSADGVAVDRPQLSKAFLADPDRVVAPLISRAELNALEVTLLTGRAADLDLERRRISLHGGGVLAFDQVIIATGSSPRSVPELEPRPGVFPLRTAADAAAVRAATGGGARVVVVGGGFIGTEVAGTLATLGRAVAVVEPLPALMMRGLGPQLAASFTRRIRAAGVDIYPGTGVAAIVGGAHVQGVQLTDGSLLPAEVVVLGLGTVPETGWLAGSGLDLRDGVRCDQHLAAAGADGVYAVGDVARWHHPRYAEDVRVEHWTNAVESAAVVAADVTGTPTVHKALPYVWTEQLGGRLQIIGQVRPQDEVRVIHGDLGGSFVALTGGADRFHGVVGFGAPKQLLPFRALLAAGEVGTKPSQSLISAAVSPPGRTFGINRAARGHPPYRTESSIMIIIITGQRGAPRPPLHAPGHGGRMRTCFPVAVQPAATGRDRPSRVRGPAGSRQQPCPARTRHRHQPGGRPLEGPRPR